MPRKTRRAVRQREEASPLQRRIHIAWKNLVLFLILFIVSLGLFLLSSSGTIFNNLFWIIFMLSGFVALALLIVLIVFLIIKKSRSR